MAAGPPEADPLPDARHVERARHMLSQVRRAVLRAGDEAALRSAVCDVLAGEGGYHLSWIGMARDDLDRHVEPVSWAGPAADYLKDIVITWKDEPSGRGPTGRCIREKTAQVARFILTDPSMEPWRDNALRHGFQASCALPLDLGEYGMAALMVYSEEPDAFDEDELALLADLSADVAYGIVTLRDRRGLDEALRRLQESETRLREAQALGGMGDWELDLRTDELRWSDEIFHIFEIDKDRFDASYEAFLEAIHPEDRDAVNQAYTKSLEDHTPYTIDHRLLMPDGRIKHVHEHCRTDYAEDGTPLRSIGTVLDITHRIEAEETKRELEETEQEVERLAQENQMRMMFLNAAAHDLNTPLTPIRLQLAVLKKKVQLTEDNQRSLAAMERNITRMQVLIQDLLDAARLQAGRLQLRRSPIAIGPLLDDAAAIFREQIEDAGLRLDMPTPPYTQVDADPDKVTQVLFNLLSNAVKFTPRGGEIRFEAHTDGDALRICVCDDGIGLTPDQIGMLFKPFSRPHENIEGIARGTGLGLYISKGIVEEHGGQIGVESDGPGKGSTFWFTLPLA